MATRYQIFKKSSSPNPVNGFENFFHRKIPQSTVYQSCSKNFDPLKNMASRGGPRPFSLYVLYRKTEGILLLWNHLMDFNNIWQQHLLGDSAWILFISGWYLKRHVRQDGRAYFPYTGMYYMEKLKKNQTFFSQKTHAWSYPSLVRSISAQREQISVIKNQGGVIQPLLPWQPPNLQNSSSLNPVGGL